MSAGVCHLYIEKYATCIFNAVYEDESGEPIPLSFAEAQARPSTKSDTLLFRLTSDTDDEEADGYIVLDEEEGTVTFTLPPEVTGTFSASTGFWDMLVTTTEGRVDRIVEGRVTIVESVTRPIDEA